METTLQHVTFDLPIINGKIDTSRILHMSGVDYKSEPKEEEIIELGLNNETARLVYRLVETYQAKGVIEFTTIEAAEAYAQGGIVDISTVSSDNPLFLVIPFYQDNYSFTHAVVSSFYDFEEAVSCAVHYARASKDRLKYGVFSLSSVYVLSRSVKSVWA